MKPGNQRLVVSLGLAACVLAVFSGVGALGFVDYDDSQYVTENEIVRQGLTGEGLVWALTTHHSSNWHPLTWLSHMADVELFGMEPAGHHWVSVVLHLTSTILLFLVLSAMTGRVWPSAFVAAVFGVHPLHVQSVVWIAERKDVLSGLFWMLVLLAYLGYSRKRSVARYLLLLLAFTAGLMAKPMLVTLPFVLLLLDLWPLRRWAPGGDFRAALRLLLEKVPLLVASLVSCWVTFRVQHAAGSVGSLGALPLGLRLENAAVSYVRYLLGMFWPGELAVLYPLPAEIPALQAAGSLLLLIAVTAGVLALAGRLPSLAVGWLWYLGTLVPVIGIVQVGEQSHADRYTYIPFVGLSIMIAFGVARLVAGRRKAGWWLAAATTLFVGALAWQARNETAYWKDGETLYRRALEVTRNNSLIHFNYGSNLLRQRKTEEALEHLREAVRIKPDLERARLNLGIALATQGRLDEAVRTFEDLIRLNPAHAEAHNNLGIALMSQGRPREAVARFTEAVRLDPGYERAEQNLRRALATLRGASGADAGQSR